MRKPWKARKRIICVVVLPQRLVFHFFFFGNQTERYVLKFSFTSCSFPGLCLYWKVRESLLYPKIVLYLESGIYLSWILLRLLSFDPYISVYFLKLINMVFWYIQCEIGGARVMAEGRERINWDSSCSGYCRDDHGWALVIPRWTQLPFCYVGPPIGWSIIHSPVYLGQPL